jgi:DNA polymerase III subunit gamma/tau
MVLAHGANGQRLFMATPETPATPYKVLARKYRPSSFESLVGQDAMVQTLANAFKSGRIHHAFILTGVRGVGKTTTARILARAFNYADENGAHPTLDLSKEGIHCREIIEGSHVDVMEMDAASNTGIDSIREINAMTRTPPMAASSRCSSLTKCTCSRRRPSTGS